MQSRETLDFMASCQGFRQGLEERSDRSIFPRAAVEHQFFHLPYLTFLAELGGEVNYS